MVSVGVLVRIRVRVRVSVRVRVMVPLGFVSRGAHPWCVGTYCWILHTC